MKGLTPARLTMLMFLVVGGLIVAYVAKSLLAVPERKETVRMVTIPVPSVDLEPGTLVTEGNIAKANVALNTLPEGTLLDADAVLGRVVKTRLSGFQPISTSNLYARGEYPPLEVSPGMKAVALSIPALQNIVDGLIKPGEFVDLQFTPSEVGDPRAGGGMTRTLLESVKVLAIDRQIRQNSTDGDRHSVVLELTPEEVNIVTLADKKGSLTLSLNRNPKSLDPKTVLRNKDRATLEDLLALDPFKYPDPPEAPKPPFTMTIYRGLGRSDVDFRDGKIVSSGYGAGGGGSGWGGANSGGYTQGFAPWNSPYGAWGGGGLGGYGAGFGGAAYFGGGYGAGGYIPYAPGFYGGNYVPGSGPGVGRGGPSSSLPAMGPRASIDSNPFRNSQFDNRL